MKWKVLLAIAVVGMFVVPILIENVTGTSVQKADLEAGGLHKAASYAYLSSEGGTACDRFSAYITNHGPSSVPSCRVYWYIDGERVASQTGPSLNVDETKQITSPSLCTTPGRHEVRVEVQPPNGYIDPNPSNNIDEGYFWFLS